MSKVKIEGNASGTGTFTIAAPNSNTDRTLTLPDEAGTVLTSGGAGTDYLTPTGDGSGLTGIVAEGPLVIATGGTQSYTPGVFTKAALDSASVNIGGYFDYTTNYRFTPAIAGYYMVVGSVFFDWNGSGGYRTETFIYKNGSSYDANYTGSFSGGSDQYGHRQVSTLVALNGTTDYIELYFRGAGGSTTNVSTQRLKITYVRGL
jgi:hypothetical protein